MFKATAARKKVCISFDWHHDRDYRNLMSAWIANPNNTMDFIDLTPTEINTDSVSRVKGVLTTRIREATHTLVLIGEYANTRHRDSVEIGTRNWIWWEIEQSKATGNKLVGVKLKSTNEMPDPLRGSGATVITSFTEAAIIKAINDA